MNPIITNKPIETKTIIDLMPKVLNTTPKQVSTEKIGTHIISMDFSHVQEHEKSLFVTKSISTTGVRAAKPQDLQNMQKAPENLIAMKIQELMKLTDENNIQKASKSDEEQKEEEDRKRKKVQALKEEAEEQQQ